MQSVQTRYECEFLRFLLLLSSWLINSPLFEKRELKRRSAEALRNYLLLWTSVSIYKYLQSRETRLAFTSENFLEYKFGRDGKFCALFFNYHPPIRIIGLFFCFTMLNIPGNKFDKKKCIKHTLKFFDQTTAASAQGLGFGLGHLHFDHNDEKV